jgi:hypothetical protein
MAEAVQAAGGRMAAVPETSLHMQPMINAILAAPRG